MRILVISSTLNTLTRRLEAELAEAGHDVAVELHGRAASRLKETVAAFQPELIVAPTLTRAIPDTIVAEHLCLLVEPCISMDGEYCDVTLREATAGAQPGRIFATGRIPLLKPGLYREALNDMAVDCLNEAIETLLAAAPPEGRKGAETAQGMKPA